MPWHSVLYSITISFLGVMYPVVSSYHTLAFCVVLYHHIMPWHYVSCCITISYLGIVSYWITILYLGIPCCVVSPYHTLALCIVLYHHVQCAVSPRNSAGFQALRHSSWPWIQSARLQTWPSEMNSVLRIFTTLEVIVKMRHRAVWYQHHGACSVQMTL